MQLIMRKHRTYFILLTADKSATHVPRSVMKVCIEHPCLHVQKGVNLRCDTYKQKFKTVIQCLEQRYNTLQYCQYTTLSCTVVRKQESAASQA